MEHYSLKNTFNGANFYTDGELLNTSEPTKFLSIPINLSIDNTGYEDVINQIISDEVNKNVNLVNDRETIKFSSAIYNTSEKSNLKFKFYFSSTAGTYGDSFIYAGFTQDDITNVKNRLTKSFFKLDFYDGEDDNKNYLFSEFINVNLNVNSTTFDFNRIYWLKNDTKFINENTYRKLYFDVTFFNAKDGSIKKFINRNIPSAVYINEYKNNPSWRYSEFRVLNPYTNVNNLSFNNNKVFYVEPRNGNTDTLINFVEIKII